MKKYHISADAATKSTIGSRVRRADAPRTLRRTGVLYMRSAARDCVAYNLRKMNDAAPYFPPGDIFSFVRAPTPAKRVCPEGGMEATPRLQIVTPEWAYVNDHEHNFEEVR